jgi:hypothetical protein
MRSRRVMVSRARSMGMIARFRITAGMTRTGADNRDHARDEEP